MHDFMALCDTDELLTNARCFSCLPLPVLIQVQTYLLCQLLANGGTGGSSGASSGPANPSADPGVSAMFYLNTTDNSFWAWNDVSGTWVPLVV